MLEEDVIACVANVSVPASHPDVSLALSLGENVRAKEGGKETTGDPSHSPLRFITSRSPLPWENRGA